MFDGFAEWRKPKENSLRPVNIASSLFFETPVEIFRRVHREIRPRTPIPPLSVSYKRFANANSNVRLQDGGVTVNITDLLESAPAPVTESLAHILLGKLYRKPATAQFTHRYRLYMNRRDMRDRVGEAIQTRGRKVHSGPQGDQHNLEALFDELNAGYFGGMMARPALGWSIVRSRTRLGHYDPSHKMIVISRIFDDPRTPRLALQYVMFHEMLHLEYPVEHKGSRRCVHTREFKAHEKTFPQFKEASAMLTKLPR